MATQDKFYYVEGNSSVKELVKNLTKEICDNAGIYKWELVYPMKSDSIQNFSLIKAKTSYGKEFYVRLERTASLTPTDENAELLKKAKNAQAFTEDEIKLLDRYVENMPYTSAEERLFKKNPNEFDEDEELAMQEMRMRKHLDNERELELLRKYYSGKSLNTSEQNELDTYKNKHKLDSKELKEWEQLKSDKKLYYDSIVLVLYKQYNGEQLTASEERSLASYRRQMELSEKDQIKLTKLKGQMDNRNHLYISIGTEIHETQKILEQDGKQKEVQVQDLVEETCSVPARLAWFKELSPEIGEWLPVQYWMNVTKDAVNIVLTGDSSADNYAYKNYLTSYAYIGAIKPVEDSAYTDDKYNFAVTTSSDMEPFYTKKFGERTATGITDVCMIANKIGMPMSPHYPGFYTTHMFMDKCNTQGSRWNHYKHQFSDITLVHPVDMERGKMINVLAGDGSAIYDMDKLVYKKGTEEEENYKKFKITAPYCFLNNSANNLYTLAIRCYKTTE